MSNYTSYGPERITKDIDALFESMDLKCRVVYTQLNPSTLMLDIIIQGYGYNHVIHTNQNLSNILDDVNAAVDVFKQFKMTNMSYDERHFELFKSKINMNLPFGPKSLFDAIKTYIETAIEAKDNHESTTQNSAKLNS